MMQAGRLLGQASAMMNHAVAERLGIHPTSWECLTLLLEYGEVPAGRLAELTGLTTGAVTALVDRLEAAGYVTRRRDPDDRRRVIVALIPSALGEVQPMCDPMLADMHKLHRNYSDDEMKAMESCLQSAADILRRHALRIRTDTAEQRAADRPRGNGKTSP